MQRKSIDPTWVQRGLDAAIEMAEKGWREGGIPAFGDKIDLIAQITKVVIDRGR